MLSEDSKAGIAILKTKRDESFWKVCRGWVGPLRPSRVTTPNRHGPYLQTEEWNYWTTFAESRKHTSLYENRQTVTRPHFPKQAWLTRIREKLLQKIKVEFSLDFSTVRNDGSTKCQIKERKWWSQLLNQLRVDSHCAHHLIQLKRGQNEIEFKGICVGRADGWMEGGGYWLRAWAAVDDKWPTKTKTSQLWREKNDQQSFKLHRKKVTRILKHPLFALGSEMTIPPGFKTYMSWTNTI